MPKAYDPSQAEGPLYQFWLDGGYFAPKIDVKPALSGAEGKEPFCIIMPPANVTGELHLGHALVDTIEDCLIRWHRMKGEPTLWLPGVDHAGIATQNVVERELAKEGRSRHDLGRDKFLEQVQQWVQHHRRVITTQNIRLGASCDWARERFTMDEGPQRAVRTTFANLYHDGLIYRGERIINWCPRCQTALSDLEVEHSEHQGHLWYVRYPLLEDEGRGKKEGDPSSSDVLPPSSYIVIATTRPETIVADVAVAVNPKVRRWRKVVGRTALLPIIERRIPVIADEAVDPRFGTGALKITPGHDQLDFEIGERHGLVSIVAISPDGTMNQEAGPYHGTDRFECRRLIVADLERLGLIEKTEEYRYSIGHCERCDTIVEPIVSWQWFVRAAPLAVPAIEAVKRGRIKIIPRRFNRVYLHWMENIRDWCISRQLWFGHRIPVWYCDDCAAQTVPAREDPLRDPDQCSQCGSRKLQQDPDVLDTWFSSALWPHSTLGWPDDTEDLRHFYPTSVLETGYDILFFWVARMIMMGLYNTGDIPFRYVYLHGLIRDAQGSKMTKSLGNVIDPLEMIDKYGCDALRYALTTGGAPGNDFRLNEERLEGGRNFANKIWNASRFVITNLAGQGLGAKGQVTTPDPKRRSEMPVEDRWIMSRAQRVIASTEKLLSDWQLGEAGRQLHDFFWGEFCDWYIEMAKVRLKAGDSSPLPVLAYVLDTSLRLLHPFIPFVTEAVWQNLREHLAWAETEALIAAPWPKAERRWLDEEAEADMNIVMDTIRALRDVRAAYKVPPSQWIQAYVKARRMPLTFISLPAGTLTTSWNEQQRTLYTTHALRLEDATPALEAMQSTIEDLARTRPLWIVKKFGRIPKTKVVTRELPASVVAVPFGGLFDVNLERERINKDVARIEQEVWTLQDKLNNEQFLGKAPEEVVFREKVKLENAKARLAALRQRLAELT